MIKLPVDIVENIFLDGDLCGMLPKDLPVEGSVQLSFDQFSVLFQKAIEQARIFLEPEDGLEDLLSCCHEYNEALIDLIEFMHKNMQERMPSAGCRFCGSYNSKIIEVSNFSKFQIACIDCGGRGKLVDSIQKADWLKA